MSAAMRPVVMLFLAVTALLSKGVFGLNGVANSVCSYYVSVSFLDSYQERYYVTCVDWDFKCTRHRTKYRISYRQEIRYYCCTGYQDNGSGYCLPVCWGSFNCPNGGSCTLPNDCTSCNDQFYSPKCDPCPVAEVANCANMRCTRGPSNKQCFKCDYQYNTVLNRMAYRHNSAQTFCDKQCSWLFHMCHPGGCNTGYPSSCSCASGFTKKSGDLCDLTKEPVLDLCTFKVSSEDSERRMSQATVPSSRSCYTEGDEWIRFIPKDFELDLIGTFTHPTYAKPAYVTDFKYGITKSSLRMFKVSGSSESAITTYTLPGAGTCQNGGPLGDDTGQPKGKIECDITKTLSYKQFADGDKLCVENKIVAGGYNHFGNPELGGIHQTQKLNDVPKTKTVCMRMDFTHPTHCSRDSGSDKCSSPTEYMTFGDRIRKSGTINLDFSGWQDLSTNPSGIKEYVINVYEIGEKSPITVGMLFSPVKYGPTTVTSTSKTFTLPSQPQYYAISLTVVDNAMNVKEARSYVLYDSSSKLLIDNTKDFYFKSATQVTDYLWQTNLGNIEVSWTDYFYNDYHRQHMPLRPVTAEANYYTDSYDQLTGDLPRAGTDNVHGILEFKYHIEELTPIRTDDPTTSKPTSWTDITTWKDEKLTLGSSVVTPQDGDTHKVWIQGTDIMENVIEDNRIIHFDSSKAELWDMWLVKDGHEQLFIHDSHELHTMSLVFQAHDVHSGIRKIFYRLGVTTGGSEEHGQGAIPVVHLGKGESCPVNGDPCYCPKIGPCEMKSYALDLNPIVANNTHIGLHNRDYFFEIEVENEARLVKTFELKVHMDNSPPTNGTVWDGSANQKDIDFKSDGNNVVGSWGGFVDYESGIKYYKYKIADRCWTTDELYAGGTKTTDLTTGTTTTTLTNYFVSVIAVNNAITPSVPSCSDGVIVDSTPPVFVSYKVPLGIFTNNQPPIYHHKDTLELSWVFTEAESQIRDYEIGFASAASKTAVPDIVGYQSTDMKAHFKRLHTGFGQASKVFVMVKAINKAGLESVEAIGPFIIDQTPPTTSKTFTPSVGSPDVTLSWSASDFSDNEDENALTSFKWALGTSDNDQELAPFTDIVESGGSYTATFPVQKIADHDHEADKTYIFSIKVFNTVKLSATVQSQGFKLPTTTSPPPGVVYDIADDSNPDTEADIDFQFSKTKMCGKWSGFAHHRDTVTYKAGIGTTSGAVNTKALTDVSTALAHCFTGLSLSDKTKYFFTVKAIGTAGDVTVSSDGVTVIDSSSHQGELEVFDGPGCTDLSSCNKDTQFQASRIHLAAWWRHSGNLGSHFTHYLVSVIEDACTQGSNAISCSETGAVVSDVHVGKVDRYVIGNLNLDTGKKYHVKVAMCFQSQCLTAVQSDGVMIYNSDVAPSSIKAVVTSVTKMNSTLKLNIEAEWVPFAVTEGTLQSKATEHKWALTSEPDGNAAITAWADESTTFQTAKIQVSHEIILKRKALKKIYFSVKGYNPLGTIAISSTPLTYEIGQTGIDEGHYIFDLTQTSNVQSLINSEKLGEKSRILHDLDIDYVTNNGTVSAAITGIRYPWYYWYITDKPGSVHHYIQWSYNLTDHPVNATNATMPMPYGCAHGMTECIGDQIRTVNNFVTFTGLNLEHGKKYFTCVHSNETIVVREKSKQKLPKLRMCSNGYVIDTSPPIAGTVTVDTVSDGFTYNSKELVIRWSGFTDLEELAGGKMYHSSGIKTYKYGIGTTPGAVDVRSFVDVGQSLSVTATGLYLDSGKTYYVVVRAFDNVGYWSEAVSSGVHVDTTPPESSFVRIGSSNRHMKVVHCDRVEVHWGDFVDHNSASVRYKVALGTHAKSQDISAFTDAAHNFAVFTGLSLVKGHGYYAQILATNVIGLSVIASSPMFTCDTTGPAKGYVYDGPDRTQGDWDYQQDTTQLSANWFGFQDAETAVTYRVAIGSTPGDQDVHFFQDVGAVSAYTFIFKLVPGWKYYVTVRGCNALDMCSTATSDGIMADDSPPLPGIVRVGYEHFHSMYQAETSSISIQWFGFHDPQTFLNRYEWCVGDDEADDCSEVSYTNAHLSQEFHKGGLSLTAHKKLYVKIKAVNNANLETVTSSNPFIIDNTAPTVTTKAAFDVTGISRAADTQYDRSMARVTFKFSDGESPVVRHVVSVQSHDDNEHPVSDYQLDASQHVTFELAGDRQMADGDQYWAIVIACNAAGLCTKSKSDPLLVDSTPPHLGHFKHTLTYGGGGTTAYLEWEEFYDGQSGIDKYVVAIGSNYHSWDVLNPTDVAHNANSATQSKTFTLAKTVNAGNVIYITIYAVNGAGMTSDIGQTSVEVVSPNTLFIQRHSCVVLGCKKVCSCGEYGATYYNCRHNGAEQNCNAVSVPGGSSTKVVDGLDINSNQAYTASDKCLSGSWKSDNAAVRYEWGFGKKSDGIGAALFNFVTEKFIFDNGLITTAVYCLPYNKKLDAGTDYSLYVRYWWHVNGYTEVESNGVRVDHTPPFNARGYGIMDTASSTGTTDIEYTTSTSAIFAQWQGTFSDTDSGIASYEVMVGTTMEGNDIVPVESVGTATKFAKSGLNIPPGTKYYVTVRAINGVGLATNKSSDGVTVDNEPPLAGVVYNGRWSHSHRTPTMSNDMEVSWTGFSDRHSFIKEYHVGIGDNENSANVKAFANVGIHNTAKLSQSSLSHGSNYHILVKAVDASGQEVIAASPSFTYDETPPTGYKRKTLGSDVITHGDFKSASSSQFSSSWTVTGSGTLGSGTGVTLTGTLAQDIDVTFSMYELVVETKPPCNQVYSEISIGNHTYLLDLSDQLTVCQFLMNVPLEAATGTKFSIYEESEVIITKISMKKVTAVDAVSAVDSISIRQIGMTDLFVHWTMTDFDSSIWFTRIALGSTPGGLQLAPLTNVGRKPYKVFRDVAVKHGLPVYVSLLVVNEAGVQTTVVSNPKLIDWVAPVFTNIAMSYVVNSPTSIDVTTDWIVQPESGVEWCYWALGSTHGGVDVLDWTSTDSLSSSTASSLTLSHGSMVYPSLRCISFARLETTQIGDPLLIVISPPNVLSASLTAQPLSATSFSAKAGYQSTTDMLDLTVAGVKDDAGIREYEVKLVDDSGATVLMDYFSVAGHTHYLLGPLPLNDTDLYNETCYNVSIVGKTTEAPTFAATTVSMNGNLTTQTSIDTTTASDPTTTTTQAQATTTTAQTTTSTAQATTTTGAQTTTSNTTTANTSTTAAASGPKGVVFEISKPSHILVCDREYFTKVYTVSMRAINKGGLNSDPVSTKVSFHNGPPKLTGKMPTLYRNNITNDIHLDWFRVFNYTGSGDLRYQVSIGIDIGTISIENRADTINTNHVIPTWVYKHHMNYTTSIYAISPFGTFSVNTAKLINPF